MTATIGLDLTHQFKRWQKSELILEQKKIVTAEGKHAALEILMSIQSLASRVSLVRLLRIRTSSW